MKTNIKNDEAKKLELINDIVADYILEGKRCADDFYQFFVACWHVLDPNNDLILNWHIEYLCRLLQKEAERIAAKLPRKKHININISPRTAKSNIVSVAFNAWCWIKWPWMRFLCLSHTQNLSFALSSKTRSLIESDWYQGHWGHCYQLDNSQNAKEFFQTKKGGQTLGYRKSSYVGGKVTGSGGDFIIQDDLLDVNDKYSIAAVQKANYVHTTVLASRLDNAKIGARINIQQRIRTDDVTGIILNDPDWQSIIIPARNLPNVQPESLRQFYSDDGPQGLFFPDLIDEDYLNAISRGDGNGLSRADLEAQYMQRPSDEIDTLYPRELWRHYRILPAALDKTIISADFSFKKPSNDKKKKSFTVIQVWSKKGPNIYLRYQWRKQCGYMEAKQAFLRVTNEFKDAKIKLIEDKANGSAILDELESEIAGLISIEPKGSKYERAERTNWMQNSGNIYLPDEHEQPWVNDFKEEHALFTGDNNEVNDQVDAQTQAMDHFDPSKNSAAKTLLKAYGKQTN